jgi:hypothetical protein
VKLQLIIFLKTNFLQKFILSYLAKFVEPLFSKPHLDASDSANNTFFCDVTKVDKF